MANPLVDLKLSNIIGDGYRRTLLAVNFTFREAFKKLLAPAVAEAMRVVQTEIVDKPERKAKVLEFIRTYYDMVVRPTVVLPWGLNNIGHRIVLRLLLWFANYAIDAFVAWAKSQEAVAVVETFQQSGPVNPGLENP